MRLLSLSVAALAGLALLAPRSAEASHPGQLVNMSQKDVTTGATIPAGQCASNNQIGIQVSSNQPTCGGGPHSIQVEIVPVTSNFTGSPNCSSPTYSNFKPSCVVKPYPQLNCSNLTAGQDYKWRVRERIGSSTGSWYNFGSSSGTDFTTGGSSTGVSIAGPYTMNEGDSITVSASAAGCGGGTYAWDFDNDGQFDDATGQSPTFDAGALGLNGTTTVSIGVQLTDNQGGVFTDATTVDVDNVAPTIDSASFSTGQFDEGLSLPFSASASDPGPDALTYTWTVTDSGGAVVDSATGASTSFAFSANGTLTVTLDVNDGEATTTQSDTVDIVNLPPVITSTPLTDATEGVLYTYQVVATDAGNDPIAYSLFSFPDGMTIDPSGLIEWTPTYLQVGGNTIRVVVSDGDGGSANQLFSVTVIFIDDDNDGMSDSWELDNGFDPTNGDDATADPDLDGRPNLQEYQEGTDPNVYDGPTEPVLVEPIDWAEVGFTRPALLWQEGTHPHGDALTHEVEVYSDEELTTLVTSTTGYVGDGSGNGLWAVGEELEENGRYWWRVRAVDAYVGGPWASSTFFVSLVNDPPPTPTALYPVGGELVETTLPTLDWSEVEDVEFDVVDYEAQVWDEAGENIVASFTTRSEARDDWTVQEGLVEDNVYGWEVRAIDEHDAASDWTPREMFLASAFNAAPAGVTWVSPEDGAEMDERSPVLVITGSVDPEGQEITYEFLVDERATFDSPDLYEISVTGPADEEGNIRLELSAEDVDVVLPDGNDFWARARAVDSEGMGSSWSQISFHVNARTSGGGETRRTGCGSSMAGPATGGSALVLLALLGLVRRRS